MNTVKADDLQKQQLEHFIFVENCLIAEIHRVAQTTPVDFADPLSSRFSKLLADFSYFEDKSKFDHIVESEENVRILDDEFYSQFNPFLKSFHKLVDEICSFVFDFIDYSEKCTLNQNLLDRKFVKLNSLKSESLYLLGVILLLIDSKFPGHVKERIFVAYYRSSVDLKSSHFELLVSLLRNRREGYETCFNSVKVNIKFTEHVVNFLKNYSLAQQSDGSQDAFFGDKQAAMIYVILFFHPDILHNQQGTMRQVVDKYFQDRWVIPLHIELTVNLIEKWTNFKAANLVLTTVLDVNMVSRKATEYGTKLRSLMIPGGLLNVEKLGEYGRLIFEYNHLLRWLILHSVDVGSKKAVSLPQIVASSSRFTADALFADFVKISHFEHKFRQSCVYLINNKKTEYSKLKTRIGVIFDQIIQLLSNDLFESETWNERLKQWMATIKDCINGLDEQDAEAAQVIEHLAQKISEVAEMHDYDQKILKQYLNLVLTDMEKLKNVCLMDLEFITRLDERRDACFVWDLLNSWGPALENVLKTDAICLKYVFLKLSASIDNVLAGVTSGFSEKAQLLSEFYHRKLEHHLRKIIQTIPRSIFAQMDSLQPLFPSNKVVHVEKIHLKQFADLERRRKLAKKTYEITKLSLGISSMCLSKLGPIDINPKELLFDGLRQELHDKLKTLLSEELQAGNILKTLSAQTQRINTFRDAFLFICEHIGFNGVALWQSELEAVFNVALQIEKNNLKNRNQVPASGGKYLPVMPIMGQIITFMVNQTNPRTSVHFCMKDEWHSVDLKKLEFTSDFFSVVEKWLPAIANIGLRRLVAFSVYSHVKSAVSELKLASDVFEPLPEMQWKSISGILESPEFITFAKRILDYVSKIGQLAVVEACLSRTMEESLHARVENVLRATENVLESLKIDVAKKVKIEAKCLESAPEFISMVERLGLAKNLIKKRANVPSFAGFAIFTVLVYYLLSVSNSKKQEFSDNYVMVTGVLQLAQALGVKSAVNKLCSVFLSDANLMVNLRYMPSVRCTLNVQNIPEALRK